MSISWDMVPKKSLKMLKDLFLLFFRVIFRIGTGTPIVNFFWETGMMKPKSLILKRTLMFIFHLANQSESALSRKMYNVQVTEKLRGIISTNIEHLEKPLVGSPLGAGLSVCLSLCFFLDI